MCVVGGAGGECWVAGEEVGGPGGGGEGGGGAVALPVRGFGLLHADVDVGGGVEVVLVEGLVFEGGADEPGCCGGFD